MSANQPYRRRNADMAGLCKYLDRSKSSVRRDFQAGLLPKPFKIGTGATAKLYFDLDEVDKALEARKQITA